MSLHIFSFVCGDNMQTAFWGSVILCPIFSVLDKVIFNIYSSVTFFLYIVLIFPRCHDDTKYACYHVNVPCSSGFGDIYILILFFRFRPIPTSDGILRWPF